MLQQERIAVEHTQISAPFTGILETRPVEVGDFLKVGDIAATLLEMDPLIVEADLPEAAGTVIRQGMTGTVQLVSGETVEGRVRFVSRAAADDTRTFKVELAIPNPDNLLPAGISATLNLDVATLRAHKLPLSLLALNDAGELGIKVVDADDMVQFVAAEIVKSAQNTVWLAGLPETVTVITVGQGFVRPGQKVDPRPEEATSQGDEDADYVAQNADA